MYLNKNEQGSSYTFWGLQKYARMITAPFPAVPGREYY